MTHRYLIRRQAVGVVYMLGLWLQEWAISHGAHAHARYPTGTKYKQRLWQQVQDAPWDGITMLTNPVFTNPSKTLLELEQERRADQAMLREARRIYAELREMRK